MAVAPHALTGDAVRARIQGKRLDASGTAFKYALMAGLAITMTLLIVLIWSQVTRGWPVLTDRGWDFITSKYSSLPTRAGIIQGITGTVTIALFVAGIAIPVGVGAAIYLEEYAAKSRLTRFIDVNIRNLAGVPSVVYGILGLAIFARALKDITGGASVMSAGITLAILVLPIVIITSAEAIRAVPDSIREAGFGVGATRWEVVRSHVIPYAMPGILTGTVLSIARALGEAAPLIVIGAKTGFFTGGDFGDLTGGFQALPSQIYQFARLPEATWGASTAAAILVLLVLVLMINSFAILLRNRYEKKR
jgi:phosphate transport system permease protein